MWCHLHIWGYWYFSWQSLIPACVSSSPVFLMMYSVYKLNSVQFSCSVISNWLSTQANCIRTAFLAKLRSVSIDLFSLFKENANFQSLTKQIMLKCTTIKKYGCKFIWTGIQILAAALDSFYCFGYCFIGLKNYLLICQSLWSLETSNNFKSF